MYSLSQELLRDYHENEEEEASNCLRQRAHRAIDPRSSSESSKAAASASPTSSPTVHVSYALSQLSQAISSDPPSSALSSPSILTSSSRFSFMLSLPSTTTPSHDKSSISFPLSPIQPLPRSLLTSSLGFPTASLLVPWPGVAVIFIRFTA